MTPAAADAAVPTGNTFDKYGSTNPVVRRLMAGFERTLDELFTAAAPASVLDVGCGEGVLSQRMGRAAWTQAAWSGSTSRTPSCGPSGPRGPGPNLEFRAMRAERLPFGDDEFDLVAATEVLEHVPDPEAGAGRDGPRGPAATCSSRSPASRCGGR